MSPLFSLSLSSNSQLIATIDPPDSTVFIQSIRDDVLPEVGLFLSAAGGIILLFAAFKALAGNM